MSLATSIKRFHVFTANLYNIGLQVYPHQQILFFCRRLFYKFVFQLQYSLLTNRRFSSAAIVRFLILAQGYTMITIQLTLSSDKLKNTICKIIIMTVSLFSEGKANIV